MDLFDIQVVLFLFLIVWNTQLNSVDCDNKALQSELSTFNSIDFSHINNMNSLIIKFYCGV